MSITPLHVSEGPEDREPARLVPDDESGQSSRELIGPFSVVGRAVNWEHSPSFQSVAALLEPYTEVRPGEFLGVLHGRGIKALTVLQVGSAFEVNPNEVPELSAARAALGLGRSYGKEGVSTRIFRLAICETVEEFSLAADWSVAGDGRAPQLLARAGDAIVKLPPALIQQTIGSLASPDQGLDVGTTVGDEPVPVVLTPMAFQFGVLVVGNPSKGKSYFSGDLLEEARDWDIPSLVIDVNGEFITAAKQLGGDVITLPDKARFGISLNLMTSPELVEITPNVQHGTIYSELIELAHAQLKRTGNVSFDDLRRVIAEIGAATEVKAPSIKAAVARVSQLERHPLMWGDYDFIGELEKHRLVVLDCRYLPLRETQLIAAMAARVLQRVGQERARKAAEGDASADKWFSLLFIDEAHMVIPDNEDSVSTQVLFELARMGRHVRTGLVLSSQSPADIHPSVLKRLQSRFIFALERDQLRSISGVLADLDEKLVASLPKLARGTCAVSGSSDVVRHGFVLKARERRTHAGGNTPKVFTGRTKAARTGKP
jgi:hypothetical protein